MTPPPDNPGDQQLWRRAAEALSSAAPVPPPADTDDGGDRGDLGDLAAFVDGRADEATRQRVETLLAADPVWRETIAELRLAHDNADPAALTAPSAVVRRAKSAHAEMTTMGRSGDHRQSVIARWARLSVAAAASLAVCAIGYQVGSSTPTTDVSEDDELVSAMSFGLFDPETDDATALDLLAINTEEAGP